MTLDMALDLLALPKKMGDHPTSGKEVKAGLGRFGPFVLHDGDFRSIPKNFNLFTITFPEALDLLSQPKKGRGRAAALKDLGAHPLAEEMIQVFNGPYGLYVKCGKVNASLPEGETAETITLQKAIELLEPKMAEMKPKKKATKAAKAKTTSAKPAKVTEASAQKPLAPAKVILKKKKASSRVTT